MKTAVSMPDDLYAAADKFAAENGLSRSALVSEALREYIARHKATDLTTRINQAVAEVGQARDEAVVRQSQAILRKNEW